VLIVFSARNKNK